MPESTYEWGLLGALLVGLLWILRDTIVKKPVVTTEQALDVIKKNTEINARLISVVENHTRTTENHTKAVTELVQVVNRLYGKLGA